MKNMLKVLVALTLLLTTAALVTASETVEGPADCKYCGMDRTKFAHSRMLVKYSDGSSTGTCSIHCTAVELANHLDKTPVSLETGDYLTKRLVNAETAYWVIGGAKMGVMTSRAKWAFANKADAEAFVREHQGTIGSFDDAIRASYEDMYQDTKMIRERRAAKRARPHVH
jgi:hypothetical protein